MFLAKVDWDLVEQDVDWIVTAMMTSYHDCKGDNSNMFLLNSDDREYIEAVEMELERHGIKVISTSNGNIGVKR